VVDQANIVSPSDRAYLEGLIRRIYDSSQVQLQVLTVKSLGDEAIEQASIAVTDKWKLGKKGDDKGVLLMVAAGDHKVRIEVGQGLEGDLPDILASRIIREQVIPAFRRGEMSSGIVAGVQEIAAKVAPDLGVKTPKKKHDLNGDAVVVILYIFFILFAFVFGLFGRRRGFWGGGGGYWGGGFGGGGGFSGGGFGGGGGWSGGGGGFSGGGASGGW
jgi:uncharacterized protein